MKKEGWVGKRSRTLSAGAAYQGAIEAVFAVLIAAGIGYWLDEKFDTAPTLFLVGLVLGFCAFMLRLLRLRPVIEESDDDDRGQH